MSKLSFSDLKLGSPMRAIALVGTIACGLWSPTNAVAVPLVDWTISGPGTISSTQDSLTDWALRYSLSGSQVWSQQTWTATATAAESGDYEFAYDYSGYHAFFGVRVFLQTINPSVFLINDGPVNCCSHPSGGFHYSGTTTLTGVLAGETFGFRFGGQNFDSDQRLQGTLRLEQVGATAAAPEPASLALLGLGLAGLGFGRRRKV